MLHWVEISAAALQNNVSAFRKRLGAHVKLGAVVKSNAYGHGMLEVADIATRAGADWLCVNGVDEGIALRRAGHEVPVLVMGYVELSGLEAVVEHYDRTFGLGLSAREQSDLVEYLKSI